MVTRRLPNDTRTTGSVIAKGNRKARGQKDAAAAVKTLNTGGRQFEELSDNDTDALLKDAKTEKVAGTDKTVRQQAMDDSGHKRRRRSTVAKVAEEIDNIKQKRAATAKANNAGVESLANAETMSDDNTNKLRTSIGNFHNTKAGSPQREIHRTAVHRLLRSGGVHNIGTSVKIPCAVPKCNGTGALHPTAGNKVNSPDATEYRCPGHVNDYDTKDVWDQLGEGEARKAAGQVARNAKSDAKKKTNAATIGTLEPAN